LEILPHYNQNQTASTAPTQAITLSQKNGLS
jgi:hypothetical protein